jgi:hypothetical protein
VEVADGEGLYPLNMMGISGRYIAFSEIFPLLNQGAGGWVFPLRMLGSKS